MPPSKSLGNRPTGSLESCARASAIGVGRTRVAWLLERERNGFARRRQNGGDRSMVEVEAVGHTQNRWIPADCQLNRRPYIGRDAAAHPRRAVFLFR